MLSNRFLQLGEWNPQLLRELRGRLRWRNVITVTGISLLGQLLVLLSYRRGLLTDSHLVVSRYCAIASGGPGNYACKTDASGNLMINWQVWWFYVFHELTWVTLLLLLLLGSYLLIKNIAYEERRGTFTFVRLSPQSSPSILLGKLLGVPVLLYLATALMLPLHMWAGIHAGLSLQTVLLVYLLATIVCGFVYLFSLYYALGWGAKAQAWYVMLIACFLYLPMLPFWTWLGDRYSRNLRFSEFSSWYQPLTHDVSVIYCVLLLIFLGTISSYQLWRMCNHRFHNSLTPF